jgi:hypothetical protein
MVRLLFDRIKGKSIEDFFSDIKEDFFKLSLDERKVILLDLFKQKVSGVELMHKIGIIHSNL